MIDLEGFVLLGPGSEWFWFMAQAIALAATGLAIFRQLRAQRSASRFDQLTAWNREFFEPYMVHVKLELLRTLRHRDPAEGLPLEDDEVPDFFERLGYLMHRGHVSADDFWYNARPLVSFYWGILEPYVAVTRASGLAEYRWFEWLEMEMRRLDRKRTGAVLVFDAATRDAQIGARIALFEAKLARDAAIEARAGRPARDDRPSMRPPAR